MNAPAGIALQLVATVCFALMSALVRHLADRIPSGEIVFARSFLGLLPLFIWVGFQGRLGMLAATRQPFAHVVRGLVGVSAMWLGFLALIFIPLAEAIAFTYVTPLVAVVLAAVLLREKVPLFRWGVLAVGLLGVLVMLWPSFSHAETGGGPQALIGAGLALASAIGASFALTQVRYLTKSETNDTIVFYFGVVASLAGLATLPFGWVVPGGLDLLALVGVGVTGGLGQICLTAAHRYAPASVVMPLNYATLLWATLIGIAVFAEWPHPVTAAGAGVVILAGLALIWRERAHPPAP